MRKRRPPSESPALRPRLIPGAHDLVEELLVAERESRRARAREMFARIACFPGVKTLDQYGFNFATGAPRKQIMELASLAFVERAENVVFLGPSDPTT